MVAYRLGGGSYMLVKEEDSCTASFAMLFQSGACESSESII